MNHSTATKQLQHYRRFHQIKSDSEFILSEVKFKADMFLFSNKDLAKVINDGLFYYEEGLWDDGEDDDDDDEPLDNDEEESWTIDRSSNKQGHYSAMS